MRAVVSGAGGGLGSEFLRQLAGPGVEIIAADLGLEAAKTASDRARQLGARVTAIECDVSSPEDVAALKALAAEKWGGIDLLVNNAAMFVGGSILDVDEETVSRALLVNIGAIHLTSCTRPSVRLEGSHTNVPALHGRLALFFQRVAPWLTRHAIGASYRMFGD